MEDYPFGYIIIGLLIGLVIIIIRRIPGLQLQSKFKKLGSMAGMSRQQIIDSVGTFQSIRHLDDGGQLCVWQAGAFVITIQFTKDEQFLKIITQTVVK